MINISFFFIYLGFEFSFKNQLGSNLSCNITTPSFTVKQEKNQINPQFTLQCYNSDETCQSQNFKFFDVVATPGPPQGGCAINPAKNMNIDM